MVQLMIEVPDDLAVRLTPVQNRLVDILELGLRELAPGPYPLHNEVVDFLASGPSPQEIVRFRPSENDIARVRELLEKNQAGLLTESEQAELDQYETLDYFMTLVKARARLHLGRAA
jgi:hypothetical protein